MKYWALFYGSHQITKFQPNVKPQMINILLTTDKIILKLMTIVILSG